MARFGVFQVASDPGLSLMVRFGCRKNYIGQLEILAAVAVYFSMPELRGRRVLHWIDNTGAVAALTSGMYARAPDSVS